MALVPFCITGDGRPIPSHKVENGIYCAECDAQEDAKALRCMEPGCEELHEQHSLYCVACNKRRKEVVQ